MCWLVSQWLAEPCPYLMCFCLTAWDCAEELCLHWNLSLFYSSCPASGLCWVQECMGKGSRQNIHLHFWCACDIVVWWCYWVRRSKLLAYKLITHLGSGDNIVTNITTSRLRSYWGNIMSWFVLQNQIAVGISLCKVRIILKPFKGRFLTIQIWNFGLGFLVWHNVNMHL